MDEANGLCSARPTMKASNIVPLACEPFRATKLWNDAVRAFYNGVPLSRHWRGLRQYENCFTATEAVDWLHGHLKSNPNFGPSVKKEQTIKLLRKFLKSGLIVEARGNKIYPEDFRENRELYKFGNRSPLKSLRTPRRIALASLYNIVDGSSPNLKKANLKLTKNSVLKEQQKCFNENFNNEYKDEYFKTNTTTISNEETDKVWKETFFKRLEEISEKLLIAGDGNTPLVLLPHIDSTYIRQNMKLVNQKENAMVQVEKKSLLSTDLPDWILSAMKCLASWPNYSESICNIPNYPGVEIDIFRVVRDYFVNIVIPLIPYELYDAVVRLYIGSEFFDIVHRSPKNSPVTKLPNDALTHDEGHSCLTNADSVEDLLLNMSINGNQQTSTPCLEGNDNHQLESISKGHHNFESTTPISSSHNIIYSAPLSLKLNKLQEYTDFKESYLYSDFNNIDSINKVSKTKCSSTLSGTESLNRRTLKALKNRSRSNFRANSLQCENIYGNIYTPPMIFDKLLKSEELDNYLLPPNSCFETAFTSDSPKTRIIPQKSVDTIHFRNSIRPKSIAVSSCALESQSCNNLDELKSSAKYINSTYLNKINKLFSSQVNLDSSLMNKSQSEGNLNDYFAKSLCDVSGVPLSPPEHFKEGFPLSKSKHIDMASKNSFASRLRDSLKRKRMKDNCQPKKVSGRHYLKRESSSCKTSKSNSTETLISINENEVSTSLKTSQLRTKSGGYHNSAIAALSCSPVDNLSTGSSVLEMRADETNFGNVEYSHFRETANPFEHYERDANLLIRPPSNSMSCNSDLSYQSKSISLSSQFQSDISSSRFSRNCCNRSKSATPTGCLSHSLASSHSNTMYHSALSVLNQNGSYHLPDSNVETGIDHKLPTLPKRAPFIKEVFNESIDDDFGLHDYQNLSDLSFISKKPLSTSASELSDSWTDRTPFGRVPPYIREGLWKHYYSSPSKRLIGRHNGFEKFLGKDACVPGLLTKIGKEVCTEALQLIFLLLEPQRRRTLYLLLRMMNKASSNDKLQLDKETTNRALMVRTFSRSVLLSEKELDYDEVISVRILTFLMDNHESIFSPPQHLAVLVHRKINTSTRPTPVYLENQVTSSIEVLPVQHKTYCQQVSPKTFEKQKLSGSQLFLYELLDQILDNPKLSDKERRKKLHEFKIHYPEIYETRFPSGKENEFLLPEPKKRLKGFKKFASIKSLARTKSFRI